MEISHRDLDNNFNFICDYINNDLLPRIESLSFNRVLGVKGSHNNLLRNVGDGTTIFDTVSNSDLADHMVSLDKFKQVTPNAAIYGDLPGNLNTVPTPGGDRVLVSGIGNLPRWKKITYREFSDKAVTSEKVAIGTLSSRHLSSDIIGKPLGPKTIESIHIKDLTIPESKIQDNSFTNDKISVQLMSTRALGKNLKFKAKCFTARTIKERSVDFMKLFTFQNSPAPKSSQVLHPKCIPLNLVKLNITSSDNAINISDQMDNSIIASCIKDRSLDIPNAMSRANLRLLANPKYDDDSEPITKSLLSPELKSILVNKGGLKP